jgi:hypothetical protein
MTVRKEENESYIQKEENEGSRNRKKRRDDLPAK